MELRSNSVVGVSQNDGCGVGSYAGVTPVQSAIAGAAEGGLPLVKRDPAQLKRLLERWRQGVSILECARKDGEFLHLLVKATRARNVLELGTSHGFRQFGWGSAGRDRREIDHDRN